ncbi:MAG: FMN-dependent NADH-azoreductase [Janthinobacterium lividum]
MTRLLNIQSSPRGSQSASIAVADAFLSAYLAAHPETSIDTLNLFEENLPEYDAEAIGAKYKGAADQSMDPAETALWDTIKRLAGRFQQADRIVMGVPMWNFAYPYKLKQLIDLASQRNMLFTFDGTNFGPKLSTPKALVIYTRGQSYAEGSVTPASTYDYQTGFIDFWLKFIGVEEVVSLTVENTWSDEAEQRITAGKAEAAVLARTF